MANEHKQTLSKCIGRGGSSQKSYSIDVTDGRILYTTENEGHAFMRDGDDTSTKQISLDDLKNNGVRGGSNYYEAARIEVERQLQLMKESDTGSPFLISHVAKDFSSFQVLLQDEQRMLLLRRLAVLFPRGQTFDPHSVPVWIDVRPNPDGLAFGFPERELSRANVDLLSYTWHSIVHNGYAVEAPPGSKRYEITDVGWAVVEHYIVHGLNDLLPF